jgi:hypothetical protein
MPVGFQVSLTQHYSYDTLFCHKKDKIKAFYRKFYLKKYDSFNSIKRVDEYEILIVSIPNTYNKRYFF